jgi:hypothetical protein
VVRTILGLAMERAYSSKVHETLLMAGLTP